MYLDKLKENLSTNHMYFQAIPGRYANASYYLVGKVLLILFTEYLLATLLQLPNCWESSYAQFLFKIPSCLQFSITYI